MKTLTTLLVLLSLTAIGFASTIYVPDHFPTIQGAIDASANGDVVIVRPGTYIENIKFSGKAIRLESELGAALTAIDGGRIDCVVSFSDREGSGSVLDGFTITNGSGSGAGIDLTEGTSPTISNNMIDSNFSNFYGGGIRGYKSDPLIIGNLISGNVADASGGAIHFRKSSPTIRDNTISGNSAGSGGGAITVEDDSFPIIDGNVISGNTTDGSGGAIYCDNCTPSISNNTVDGNVAKYGGGVYCFRCPTVDISWNTISGNSNGGIYSSSSSLFIDNNTITGSTGDGGICFQNSSSVNVTTISSNYISANSSERTGGGIQCFSSAPAGKVIITGNRITKNSVGGSGGGIYCSADSSEISFNRITGNIASGFNGGSGGGIYVSGGMSDILFNSIVKNDALQTGGGIVCSYNSRARIAGNFISYNSSGYSGGGLYCSQSSPTIVNNTVYANSAGYSGGGLWVYHYSSPVVTNSIFWNNTASTAKEFWLGDYVFPSTLTVRYSDVEGGQASCSVDTGCVLNWGSGILDLDPLFVDSGRGDLHIQWNSPCRNSGNNSSATESADFEGDPRISLGTVDMGADEFYYHLYSQGTVSPGSVIDVKIVGKPGLPTLLGLGQGVQGTPTPTQHGGLWLTMPLANSWTLQAIPPTGVLAFSPTIPSPWGVGSDHPFQAFVGRWGGADARLTNLMILTVE